MKFGFYPKLAWTGIVKNRRTYVPFLLTCIGMVMMFYLISFLSMSPTVADIPIGGGSMQLVLNFGSWVVGIFSVIFLFYTHSFLIRRRKKEFGLYNILGMGKGNLTHILIWENIYLAALSLAGGLFLGILLSKAGELFMARILKEESAAHFSIGLDSMGKTVLLFAVIFLLLLLHALKEIHIANPVELLRSETVGEKPPKSNWMVAFLGLILLAGAY